jgi:hypothetical protein
MTKPGSDGFKIIPQLWLATHVRNIFQIGQHILSFPIQHPPTPYSVTHYSSTVDPSEMSERVISERCKTPRKPILNTFTFSLTLLFIWNIWCARVFSISVEYTVIHVFDHSVNKSVKQIGNWQCIVHLFGVSDLIYTVGPGYNIIGISDTSPAASDIVLYQLIRPCKP